MPQKGDNHIGTEEAVLLRASGRSGASKESLVSVLDILCEGPIRGLVNGAASVFLNDNPAESASLMAYEPPSEGETGQTYSATSSGTVTFTGSASTADGRIRP